MERELDELFSLLQSSPEPVAILNKILDLVNIPGAAEVVQRNANSFPLQFMFSLLNSAHEEQIITCCDVLDKIFSYLPAETFRENGMFVELGLQHLSVPVKLLSLKFVDRCAEDVSLHNFILTPTMFHLVVQLLGHPDVDCAMATGRVIQKMANNSESMDVMFAKRKGSLVGDLEQILLGDATVRFRVYELMYNIAATSTQNFSNFSLVASTGIFVKLIKELDEDDVLVQLNCLEMLTKFVQNRGGVEYLEQQEVVKKLHALLSSIEPDSLTSLLIPGLLKFFAYLVLQDQVDVKAICTQYPAFMDIVYSSIEQTGSNLWANAVQTFGALGTTLHSRQALLHDESKSAAALKTLGCLITSASSEVRVTCMEAVSLILACPKGFNEDATIVLSYEKIFCGLGEDFTSLLYSVGRQPFSDLRCAMLKVLASLVMWKWGQEKMKGVPGFIEFLLDRSTEVDKTAKELRYSVIHSLANSATSEIVFGALTHRKIREYDQEGPFYVAEENVVAMEEA